MLDKSQINAVERHLNEKGSITSIEAFDLYGATRLSAIIYNLRRRYLGTTKRIDTMRCKGINRYGHTQRYGKYVLKEVDR